MRCPYCGASHFRLSRLRISDLIHLLRLRYPVRCRLCRERTHVSFAKAMQARSAARHAHGEAAKPESAPKSVQ